MANCSKKKGASYEARFTAEALARGFEVLHPAGDYLSFDLMLLNSSGEPCRVQVKGTAHRQKNKISYKVFAVTRTGETAKNLLTPEQADVLAVYVEPADAWYLIPVDKLVNKGVYLSPDDENSVGRYEPWREAWNVFA
tara:strand:- start:462 stop:875 length:414 start_codon:yes stop_codon:yes gene_type:complete